MALFWLPGRHWSDPRAQNSIKTNVFLTFRKSLRGPLERLRAAQRRFRGVLLVFARGPGGALGDPGISDRTPEEPRWGPKGGEQGLRNNKTHIYSGQGFRKKKNASRSYHRHFFLGIALFRFTCDKNRRASRDPRELPEPPKDLPRTSGDPKMAVSTAKYACISDLSPFI